MLLLPSFTRLFKSLSLFSESWHELQGHRALALQFPLYLLITKSDQFFLKLGNVVSDYGVKRMMVLKEGFFANLSVSVITTKIVSFCGWSGDQIENKSKTCPTD